MRVLQYGQGLGPTSKLPSISEFGVYRRSKPKDDFDFTSALALT